MGGGEPVGGAPIRGDRLYLGWEFALRHADPGPSPRRPLPPVPQQVNPGWVAAQRREEWRLSRPLRAGAAAGLAAAGAAAALGALGIVTPALAVAGVAASAVLALAGARGVWRGRRDLRDRLAAEERRVGLAQAAADRRLAAWQDEHSRRLREWQARGQAFRTQAQWYGVALPAAIDRIDVAGGTLGGWSALVAMLGGFRLAAGGEVTVLDLSEGAVARDLLGMARGLGVQPLVWVLPGDLARFDLGADVPGDVLADLLAVAASAAADPACRAVPGRRARPTRRRTARSWNASPGCSARRAGRESWAGRPGRAGWASPGWPLGSGCLRRSVTRALRCGAGWSARRRPRRSPGCTAGPPPTGSSSSGP